MGKKTISKKIKTLVSQEIIDEFSLAIGEEKIYVDQPTRMNYTLTHGPEFLLHENYLDEFLPDAVLKPSNTQDVQNIVRIANKFKVPIVVSGGRSGSYGAEGMRGAIIIDMCGMDKIIELDEKNYRVTGEAGVRMVDLVSYLKKRGYMATDWPGSDEISTLGSRPSVNGYNFWENRFGSAGKIIQAIEVVLPNGEVVHLGRGSSKPSKSSIGWNLMDLFVGSKGTLGIVTKVTEEFADYPPNLAEGQAGFRTFKEGIGAYLDLKKSKYSNNIWRLTCTTNERIHSMSTIGKKWPNEIAMVVGYQIFGQSYEVEGMKKIAEEILKKHNGFTTPELTENVAWWDEIASEWKGIEPLVNNYAVSFASHVFGGRIDTKGYSAHPVSLDPVMSDGSLLDFFTEWEKLVATIEDGYTYPNLAKCVKVDDPGEAMPSSRGFNKMWVYLHVYEKNLNRESRKEFVDWFRKHVELVWKYGGVISNVHGWVPRELEVEMVKRTVGEREYELMKKIKRLIDPNNIMNPKLYF
jgi:glycolate oxidase